MAAGAGLIVWPWLVTNVAAPRDGSSSRCWPRRSSARFRFSAAFCWNNAPKRARRPGLVEQCRRRMVAANRDRHGLDGRSVRCGALLYLALRLVLVDTIPGRVVGIVRCDCPLAPASPADIGVAAVRLRVGVLLVAVLMGGSWSWWEIGFVYGTQKHHEMQLGRNSLSNLSSILARTHISWQLHDQVGTLNLPWIGTIDLDIQGFSADLFRNRAMCAAAAAMQMRRRDPRFLIVLARPGCSSPPC